MLIPVIIVALLKSPAAALPTHLDNRERALLAVIRHWSKTHTPKSQLCIEIPQQAASKSFQDTFRKMGVKSYPGCLGARQLIVLHLADPSLPVGQELEVGATVGEVGSCGPDVEITEEQPLFHVNTTSWTVSRVTTKEIP